MGRRAPQLEFRWASWFRGFKALAVPPSLLGEGDGELTAWCMEAAQGLALHELSQKVRVSWNPRMRTTAGRAWWPDRRIELNPKLKDCDPDEIWRTLKHELAHLVAYERCGRRRIEPHGAEWQLACRDLGIPGEKVCHRLPFEPRRMERKHVYHCASCLATIQRVRPLKRAVACFECCRKFNNGTYHERFRLVKKQP
jgi:predicted SprT family Zn-dependent metalloprotease